MKESFYLEQLGSDAICGIGQDWKRKFYLGGDEDIKRLVVKVLSEESGVQG